MEGPVNSNSPASVQNSFDVACGLIIDGLRNGASRTSIRRLWDITGKEYAPDSNYNSLQISVRRTISPLTLAVAYTYSHSLDDESDWQDVNFVNSYDLKGKSRQFQFRRAPHPYGELRLQYSVRTTRRNLQNFPGQLGVSRASPRSNTGTPFSVTNGIYGDNAGVANGVGTNGSYPDVIGKANSSPSSAILTSLLPGTGPLLFNPDAFAAPQGLTFGDAGRNSLNNPNRVNFDMALYKNFPIKEHYSFQFRAESFNIFNHTNWNGVNGSIGCYGGTNNSAGDPFVRRWRVENDSCSPPARTWAAFSSLG